MAVHESQSLFWENRIARSRPFAEQWWQRFQAAVQLNGPDDLWQAMNPMAPGLNRVEADELSYGLHILIRTDLEIALLEEGLAVKDLPGEWNHRYREMLGVVPANDAEGCLQDVHWSEGLFGYFPSYLLGHLISAQINDHDGVHRFTGKAVEGSDVSAVLSWLRAHVHHLGRSVI